MRRPMILTIGVAVLDLHTRLAHLETNTPRNAAVGTALGRRNAKMMSMTPTIGGVGWWMFELIQPDMSYDNDESTRGWKNDEVMLV